MSWQVKTATGSDTPIILRPGFGYQRSEFSRRRYQRTEGGTMQTYTMATSSEMFTLPLDYVGSADATTISSWWRADIIVGLIVDSADQYDCRLTNRLEPFTLHEPGQFSRFNGLLQLRTI